MLYDKWTCVHTECGQKRLGYNTLCLDCLIADGRKIYQIDIRYETREEGDITEIQHATADELTMTIRRILDDPCAVLADVHAVHNIESTT